METEVRDWSLPADPADRVPAVMVLVTEIDSRVDICVCHVELRPSRHRWLRHNEPERDWTPAPEGFDSDDVPLVPRTEVEKLCMGQVVASGDWVLYAPSFDQVKSEVLPRMLAMVDCRRKLAKRADLLEDAVMRFRRAPRVSSFHRMLALWIITRSGWVLDNVANLSVRVRNFLMRKAGRPVVRQRRSCRGRVEE